MKDKDDKTQVVKIEYFLFFRAYFGAIEKLGEKNRLKAYDAICKYGLYGEEATDLPSCVSSILIVIRPYIERNRQKYISKIKKESQKGMPFVSNEEETFKKVPLPKNKS